MRIVQKFFILTLAASLLLTWPGKGFSQENPAGSNSDYEYKLSPGNKIKLVVFGEDDLSGEFEVDSGGFIPLPLIGNVKAAGLDSRELEKVIVDSFKDGYLVNPRVGIEVLNFQPFFILGEVNKPGNYPYVNGLTVINAVAMAGGYTYRAKRSPVIIQREKNSEKIELKAEENYPVYPGDTIQVLERLF